MAHNYLVFINSEALFPAAVTLIVLFLVYIYHRLKYRNLPPGPTGLPLIGFLPFLDTMSMHIQFLEMQKKYGGIFCFNIAGQLYINMGSFKGIREAFISKSECFTQKYPDFSIANKILGKAVFNLNGEGWKIQRKFFVQLFKQYGMTSGKTFMDGPIYDSLNSMMEELHAKKGEPVNIVEMLMEKCSIVTQRIFFEDLISKEEILEFNKTFGELMTNFVSFNFLFVGDIFRYFVYPFMKQRALLHASQKKMMDILHRVIERHESSFDPNNIRDIIDSYLKERHDRQKRGDPTAKFFTNDSLACSLIQFAGDGIHSIAVLVVSFLQSLTEHPEEQEKIYNELSEVIGSNRQPTLDDRNKLTYTNAFIHEMLRISGIMPVLPSLQCTRETTIGGYRIPKGAVTLINFWAIHRDPEVYEEPEKFNPSRFLPSEGNKRPELPILFGIGKRACIGEAYTMMQVFLYMITLVKNFRLTLPEGTTKKSIQYFTPENKNICAHPR